MVTQMTNYRVGWKAYTVDDQGKPTLVGIGRDVFHCSSVASAMKMAVRQIPAMISVPEAQVGIRYVKELK